MIDSVRQVLIMQLARCAFPIYTHAQTHIRTRIHTHAHAHTLIHEHTHKHTQNHTNTHTYTQTHTFAHLQMRNAGEVLNAQVCMCSFLTMCL
jgi:ABC-type nickel/cobalt efflux system permease component RcnA